MSEPSNTARDWSTFSEPVPIAGHCWRKSNDFIDLGLYQFVIFGFSQNLDVVYVSLVTVSLGQLLIPCLSRIPNAAFSNFSPYISPLVQQIASLPPLQQGNITCPLTPPFLVLTPPSGHSFSVSSKAPLSHFHSPPFSLLPLPHPSVQFYFTHCDPIA